MLDKAQETPQQAAAILDEMIEGAQARTRRAKRARVWLLIVALILAGPLAFISYWLLLAVAAGIGGFTLWERRAT